MLRARTWQRLLAPIDAGRSPEAGGGESEAERERERDAALDAAYELLLSIGRRVRAEQARQAAEAASEVS